MATPSGRRKPRTRSGPPAPATAGAAPDATPARAPAATPPGAAAATPAAATVGEAQVGDGRGAARHAPRRAARRSGHQPPARRPAPGAGARSGARGHLRGHRRPRASQDPAGLLQPAAGRACCPARRASWAMPGGPTRTPRSRPRCGRPSRSTPGAPSSGPSGTTSRARSTTSRATSSDPAAYTRLSARLDHIDAAAGCRGNRLFYLATPPQRLRGHRRQPQVGRT